jgi:putative NADPH-quinone reductase
VQRHAGDLEGLYRARAAARSPGDPGERRQGKLEIFKGKSARIVMTMGMPAWFYRWYYGAHALKLLKRNILHFCGVAPVRATIHGMIEGVSDDKRKEWLREVEALGHQAR